MMRTPAAERRQHVIAEVELLAGLRDPDDLARALGYQRPCHLDVMLRRWGREDLADKTQQRRAEDRTDTSFRRPRRGRWAA
ncbi:hypothetical protein [Propionibacterium freudenreichii]|uniref:hypothetical protein n=1 Tax=Propionibacterium freudenreichii TaxID=1744 RepID=UPI00254E4F99|nr:hypothetical protein [Propionibacterium freudenreichii]MDK9627039.1 hypothetical protein [Propionibacterium freudenreichii]